MTLEDPFVVVKEEVFKALNKTRGLYARWQDLQAQQATSGPNSVVATPTLAAGLPMLTCREELEWTSTELRNALRSIEWDLEDLEDTICIVEKNPNKFKLDNKELTLRRNFVEQTGEEVKVMKDKLNISKVRDRDRTARQPTLDNSPVKAPTVSHGTAKYSKLENEMDSPNRQFLPKPICNQNSMRRHQEDIMSDNTGTLKTVSRQINSEYDEHQVMLDDFNNEMEVITDSKLDATMKKMAKVLHMSNGNYNNYIPAPTTSTSSTSDYTPKPSSLCSLSTTITNCFLCSRD
ncbi:syntaxin-6 isoform X1 [Nasonia vitripennis]|uniref:Syntaxin 6/10/61 N-terminal domain-containing protein n=1 Tax=Nasonia vitripennis TaxID=7425 RepID=A0A7M7TDZ0_NASVI|nr:syntaxin-6 isoform X1 [Nasonia vitripennis]